MMGWDLINKKKKIIVINKIYTHTTEIEAFEVVNQIIYLDLKSLNSRSPPTLQKLGPLNYQHNTKIDTFEMWFCKIIQRYKSFLAKTLWPSIQKNESTWTTHSQRKDALKITPRKRHKSMGGSNEDHHRT